MATSTKSASGVPITASAASGNGGVPSATSGVKRKATDETGSKQEKKAKATYTATEQIAFDYIHHIREQLLLAMTAGLAVRTGVDNIPEEKLVEAYVTLSTAMTPIICPLAAAAFNVDAKKLEDEFNHIDKIETKPKE
jgi:hypothetical protein